MTVQKDPEKRRRLLDGIEGVLFDFDGTLVDSMDMWHEIDVEYTKKHEIPLPDDLHQEIEGMRFYEVAVYFRKRFSLPYTEEEIMQEWHEMAFEHYATSIPFKEGALSFLKELKKEGLRLAIATSNSYDLLMASLELHGLTDFFDAVCTAEDVTRGKPAPDVYLLAASRIGTAPGKCLVFEDVLHGIRAGKAANMRVCAMYDRMSEDMWDEILNVADEHVYSFLELCESWHSET